jgi:hypothetical protein
MSRSFDLPLSPAAWAHNLSNSVPLSSALSLSQVHCKEYTPVPLSSALSLSQVRRQVKGTVLQVAATLTPGTLVERLPPLLIY